eukprot:1145381-Pelagomonas_calceolata.AAC.7
MPGRMRSAHTHTREAHRKPGQHAKLTSFVRGDHALCVRERVYLDRLDPMRAMAAALSRVAWRQDLRTKPETLHHRNAPRLSWSQCSMHGSPKAAKPVSIQRGSYVHIRNGAQQLQHGTATANAGSPEHCQDRQSQCMGTWPTAQAVASGNIAILIARN